VLVADIDKQHGEETVDLILVRAAKRTSGSSTSAAQRGRAPRHHRARRFARSTSREQRRRRAAERVDTWNADEASWDRIIQINLKSVFSAPRRRSQS